jgi:hypothetical protein
MTEPERVLEQEEARSGREKIGGGDSASVGELGVGWLRVPDIGPVEADDRDGLRHAGLVGTGHVPGGSLMVPVPQTHGVFPDLLAERLDRMDGFFSVGGAGSARISASAR